MLVALAGLVATLLAAAAAAEPLPPQLRLPTSARPVRQAVDLNVDPNLEAFSGTVEIEVEVREPVDPLWLNAAGLSVTSAELVTGGSARPARVVAGGDDFVGVSIGVPIAPGTARLRLAFSGQVSRRDEEGIFVVKEADAFYLFTQFQAIAARKAFPCFDEPSYKIPWQVTLRVPRGLVALSNSPAVSATPEGERDVVRYAETPPLPSYLVAFAVGPFDVVDLAPAGRNRTPSRLVVPRGRGADTAWARESTGPILGLLEDYFDRPYPYAKLDQVAMPGVGFAMEHPGLVTYTQSLMVQRPAEQTVGSRRDWASTCAHELAHQWFGDLVTLAWWDDTWLNESFASWLGEKVTDRFRPDWGGAVERAAGRSRALQADSLATARRIRQPIEAKHDIYNAFDGVTYGKGQALLEMLEAWLGEDAFRRAVRSHVDRHAGGNATAADFVGALAGVGGSAVPPVIGSFLDQTGAPVIAASVRCGGGEPRLELRQRPYRALGSPAEPKTWTLPVCVRAAGRDAPACTVLGAEAGEVRLGAGTCPAWAFANAGAAGYYRVVTTAADARHLVESGELGSAERVALAGDLQALVASGDVSAADAMRLLPLLARDTERKVVDESASLARDLERVVPDAELARYRALVRAAYGERAHALGWATRPGDDEDTRLLRRTVVSVAANLGRDPKLEREAVLRLGRWLEDGTGLAVDLVTAAVTAAVGSGDAAILERLTDAVVRTSDRERRERLLGGLVARDPAQAQRLLALTLDPRLDARDSVWLLFGLGSRRETARASFDFLKAHYDEIVARLPQGEFSPLPYLPWVGAGLCEDETRSELEGFFSARARAVTGAPRVLAQVLESVDQCVARKRAHQPGVVAYLESLPAR